MNLLENLRFIRGAFTGILQWNPTANVALTLPPTAPGTDTYLRGATTGVLQWTNAGIFATMAISSSITLTSANAQTLTASSSIALNAPILPINAATDITLTAAMTAGNTGQIVFIANTGTSTITFTASQFQLPTGIASITLQQFGTLTIRRSTTGWNIVATTGALNPAWTAMPFANGWANTGGTYQAAQYSKIGNTVRCRGAIQGAVPASTSTPIATLPVGFRPSAKLFYPLSQAKGQGCDLEINTNGEIYIVWGATPPSGTIYACLDMIDFQVI